MASSHDKALKRGSATVLGMYDRNFRKPFDKKHYEKVKKAHKKATGKDLQN